MIRKKNTKTLHGQSVLEYVLLVGLITVVLVAMMQAVKRGTQSLVKVAADEIGNQAESDQFIRYNGQDIINNRTGYMESSNSLTLIDSERQVVQRYGIINYIPDENQQTLSNTLTNMGFTEVD
jgi:Flp pilus assembly pilin Flp